MVLGLSMTTLMPVLIPGPTIIGSMPRNFTMLARKECMTFGTTDTIITSCTSLGLYPLIARNSVIMSPYSSDVWLAFVVIR